MSSTPSRSYFSEPKLAITREALLADPEGPLSALARSGPVGLQHRLNVFEKDAMRGALRSGCLELNNSSSQQVVTQYEAHCWSKGQPVLVMSKHGDRILVDLAPAVGTTGSDEEAKSQEGALIKMFQEVLIAKGRDVTFVNDGVTSNISEAERTGREGRNEYKAASQVLMTRFTLYTPSRDVAIQLSRALWGAFCESKGLVHGTEAALEAKAQERLAREEARMKHHLEVLAWIERTPEIRRLMPRGSLDGYRAAAEAGTLMDVKPIPSKPSLSRQERRMKRRFRNSHFDGKVLAKAMQAVKPDTQTAEERA